jgi:hypothetical protein
LTTAFTIYFYRAPSRVERGEDPSQPRKRVASSIPFTLFFFPQLLKNRELILVEGAKAS